MKTAVDAAPPAKQNRSPERISRYRFPLILAGLLLIVPVAGSLLWRGFNVPPAQSATTEEGGATDTAGGVVQLSETKIESAGLKTAEVQRRLMQPTRTVPGRLAYDQNRHLSITSPVQGIVIQVAVKPGQQVKKGEALATVSSAEIGQARSDVLRRQADVQLARQEFKWADEVAENVISLLDSLQSRQSINEVEEYFQGRLLGEHRDHLLSAYSKLLLAKSVAGRTDTLGTQGVISGRIAEQRTSDRQVAAAAFQAECEKSIFECTQARDRTKAALDDATRLQKISREHFKALRGPFSESPEIAEDGRLNELVLKAPFDGAIQQRSVVAGTRLEIGDPIILLADTITLWLSAELREADWQALDVLEGQRIPFSVPAVPNRTFAAQMLFVGAEVSAETRALPLVAEVDNSHQKLKPGMFVWVSLPVDAASQVLAVPSGAIMKHEGEAFAFVAQRPGVYRHQHVETGLETPDWVAILSGLEEGQKVVDHGAFYLKSELLLEGEEE